GTAVGRPQVGSGRGTVVSGELAMILDAIKVARLVAHVDPVADHAMAIVPCAPGTPWCAAPLSQQGYFQYHGRGAGVTGLTWPNLGSASLVSDGTETTAAHELGHRFGEQNSGAEEYRSTPPGNVAAGFWVGGNQLFNNDAIC